MTPGFPAGGLLLGQYPCLLVYAIDVVTIPSVLLGNASTSQAEVNEQEDGNLTGLTKLNG